jgi:CRISPR-associated RAMP protein (TIGR02581 family)
VHKRRVNELTLRLVIEPDGPLLIKSGIESVADPTLPSMNFVRTRHPQTGDETVYLPGASLKGVLRSHTERIVRTVVGDDPHLCCDPLDRSLNCSARIRKEGITDTAEQYKKLCLACRMFGHMVQASHFLAADAYPDEPINALPMRHNVAIDRLSGGVAGGPFDMEVAMAGKFQTNLRLFNFELWQIGLLALVLRDLDEGRLRIGFAKSRGLGAVRVTLEELEIGYPGQFSTDGRDYGRNLYGVGALAAALIDAYGYRAEDVLTYPEALPVVPESTDWGRPAVRVNGNDAVRDVLRTAVSAWGSLATGLTAVN